MDMDMDCGDARRGKLNPLLKQKLIPTSSTDTVMVMVMDTLVDTMVMVLDTMVMVWDTMVTGDARRGKLNPLLKQKLIPTSSTGTDMVLVMDTMVVTTVMVLDTMVMVLDTMVMDGENKLLLQEIFAIKGTPYCLSI